MWLVVPLAAAESRTICRWYGQADPKAVKLIRSNVVRADPDLQSYRDLIGRLRCPKTVQANLPNRFAGNFDRGR